MCNCHDPSPFQMVSWGLNEWPTCCRWGGSFLGGWRSLPLKTLGGWRCVFFQKKMELASTRLGIYKKNSHKKKWVKVQWDLKLITFQPMISSIPFFGFRGGFLTRQNHHPCFCSTWKKSLIRSFQMMGETGRTNFQDVGTRERRWWNLAWEGFPNLQEIVLKTEVCLLVLSH